MSDHMILVGRLMPGGNPPTTWVLSNVSFDDTVAAQCKRICAVESEWRSDYEVVEVEVVQKSAIAADVTVSARVEQVA